MDDTATYLIHADITASGVVERNDVVGAIYGQTEGLLGDELDLRQLQDRSKVGRIDVDVDSERGQSFGEITVATSLGRVETALLAAALETIDRVGPCRATIEVAELEDVRRAKRRAVVDRATELLADLEASTADAVDVVEAVRQRVRVEEITEYEGYPAGPRVADGDAVVVVEGRADVLQLLQYGIKNAVAVEGTDVPEAIADLTKRRTATAFFDGDRGGELVLKELAQVGAVDYVAFAPPGTAVEELSRGQILAALREKVPYESLAASDDGSRRGPGEADDEPQLDTTREDDNPETTAGRSTGATDARRVSGPRETDPDSVRAGAGGDSPVPDESGRSGADEGGRPAMADGAPANAVEAPPAGESEDAPSRASESTTAGPGAAVEAAPDTVAGHARAVIGESSGRVRLLDADARPVGDGPAEAAFDAVERADPVPATVVLDGPVTQRLLDVAAQRGVEQVVAASEGEFVKRPTNVRIRTLDEF